MEWPPFLEGLPDSRMEEGEKDPTLSGNENRKKLAALHTLVVLCELNCQYVHNNMFICAWVYGILISEVGKI